MNSPPTKPVRPLFQSTHPRGVRPGVVRARQRHLPVSIHAPAWGATSRDVLLLLSLTGFNPRTRVGCDMPT